MYTGHNHLRRILDVDFELNVRMYGAGASVLAWILVLFPFIIAFLILLSMSFSL